MPWFKQNVKQTLSAMGEGLPEALKAARGAQVRDMWEQLMRHNHDEIILAHTNNVYIVNPDADAQATNGGGEGTARFSGAPTTRRTAYHDDGKDASATGQGKQLIVYVDDSIVSAELNARRELIKLQFLEHFGEEIDEFKIIISRGTYKQHHPFAPQADPDYRENVPSVPLDHDERAALAEELEQIEDPRLRESLRRAATADLEWKKGIERVREQRGSSASQE